MHSIGLSAIYRQGIKILRSLRSLRIAVLCVSRHVAGLGWKVVVGEDVDAEVCRFNTFEYCTHLFIGRTVMGAAGGRDNGVVGIVSDGISGVCDKGGARHQRGYVSVF
jgi:hypothetical protein